MSKIKFESELFSIGSWTILRLPQEASAQLPSRGMVMVEGTINGVDFQDALEPDGRGSHWLAVDKDLQRSSAIGAGASADIIIEVSKQWPEPKTPNDLQAALVKAKPEIRELWMDITPMARWDWIRWIRATNNPDTRAKHIEVAFSKLQNGTRRPCCFNRSACTVMEVSKNGALLEPIKA